MAAIHGDCGEVMGSRSARSHVELTRAIGMSIETAVL